MLQGPQSAGIHRVSSGNGARVAMPPGEYVVTLDASGRKLTQKARLLETPPFR